MRFLHYTLNCKSPFVKIYSAFQHADLITVSSATYAQLTYCDPLNDFRIISAQDVTQTLGSAILYRPSVYTLLHFIPSNCSVTLALMNNKTKIIFLVTAVTLTEHAGTNVFLLLSALRDVRPFINNYTAHIISGDFKFPRIINDLRYYLLNIGYHDLLGQISPGPTRFRLGHAPDVVDYIFYKGPVAAMECLKKPMRRPDIEHEGSDHSPIYVYFFLGKVDTFDV